MGIGWPEAEMLLFEHKYRPIRGDLLTIGRQTVSLSPTDALGLLARTGVPVRRGVQASQDRQTVHNCGDHGWISDQSFYELFSDARLLVMDVSAYEQADIIHDMSQPVGPELENRFDFIINGSCLDNIFDPATAMRNTARMLKPGGRLFQFEWANSHPTAYLKYSPDWFLDFFAVNEFLDCKVYVFHPRLEQATNWRHPAVGRGSIVDLYLYDPVVTRSEQLGYECSHINSFGPQQNFVVAEKAPGSTWNRTPIQKHYRVDEWHRQVCLESAIRFNASNRPAFTTGRPPVPPAEPFSEYETMRLLANWLPGVNAKAA
jgi:SAM-dependent methyltransferase